MPTATLPVFLFCALIRTALELHRVGSLDLATEVNKKSTIYYFDKQHRELTLMKSTLKVIRVKAEKSARPHHLVLVLASVDSLFVAYGQCTKQKSKHSRSAHTREQTQERR